MRTTRRSWRAAAALLCTAAGLTAAAGPDVEGDGEVFLSEDFEGGLPPLWRGDPLPRMRAKGVEVVAEEGGNRCLAAAPEDAFAIAGVNAGALQRPLRVQEYSLFSWRWRVSAPLRTADAGDKDKDDFAARFFVAFKKRSWWPGDVQALIYVWDNRHPVGAVLPSTWGGDRARLVVLRSGGADAGGWVEEERDVYRDFQAAFPGQEPGPVRAFAFAADTDQTAERVEAAFDDLVIRRR